MEPQGHDIMRVVMKKHTAEDEGPLDCLGDNDVDVGTSFGEKNSMWSSFNTFVAHVI